MFCVRGFLESSQNKLVGFVCFVARRGKPALFLEYYNKTLMVLTDLPNKVLVRVK